jgi:hypothetical protein
VTFNIQWREVLRFNFGVEMHERVSSVMMKSLHSSLKKVKYPDPLESKVCIYITSDEYIKPEILSREL